MFECMAFFGGVFCLLVFLLKWEDKILHRSGNMSAIGGCLGPDVRNAVVEKSGVPYLFGNKHQLSFGFFFFIPGFRIQTQASDSH